MTAVTTLLAGIKKTALSATEGPLEVVLSPDERFACVNDPSRMNIMSKYGSTPVLSVADARFFASARTDVLRLLQAVEAVQALHIPLDAFEYDDMNGVFKLDEDGEQIPAGSFCQECSDPDVIQSIEDCEYTEDEYGEVRWPCPTITAVVAALGGEE